MLRLAIVSPKKDQVTDGHWWVKWVTKLETKAIEQEWTLTLTGAVTEEMDRATFETGAAEGCHGQELDRRRWEHVDRHPPIPSCRAGVTTTTSTKDRPTTANWPRPATMSSFSLPMGVRSTVNSTAMYYNKDLIVAYKMNGEALPEEYWPLRLVGEGIDATDMIGGVTEIKALVPTQ